MILLFDVYANILTYEKIGNMLVVEDFNAIVGTYQNVKLDYSLTILNSTSDSTDFGMSNYGRHLVHMLIICINVKILNGTHAFTMNLCQLKKLIEGQNQFRMAMS
mgnify:CR=1 FL=1